MSVIQIPGGTATLRDQLVSERHFELIEVASTTAAPAVSKLQAARGEGFDELPEEEQQALMMSVQLTFDEALSLKTMQKAAIVAFVEHWSRGPLPTMETVSDLPRDVFRALSDAVTPLMLGALGPGTDFSASGATDERGRITNATPTADSASSATPSVAGAESTPIPASSVVGESTATAPSTPA